MPSVIGRGRYARWTYPVRSVGAGVPPTGAASGDLGATYPNPTVVALEETGDPARLAIGVIPDLQLLVRSGTTVVGAGAAASPVIVVNRIDNSNLGGSKLVDVVTTSLLDGAIAAVYSVGALFELVKSPTAELLAVSAAPSQGGGILVVASAATVGDVWVRIGNTSNQRFATNPPLFIDPALGNDDNDGLSSGANALKSADEWCRRMNGAEITTNLGTVTVNCAAGDVGNFGPCVLVSKVPLGGVVLFRFLGSKTISVTGTVSSIVPEDVPTQTEFQFTDSSGTGPAISADSRLRITASATPSHVQTVGVVRGFGAGGATNPYTSRFSSLNTTIFPSASDSYVVETLTTFFHGCSIIVNSLSRGHLTCQWEDLEKTDASSSLPAICPQSNLNPQAASNAPTFLNCRTTEIVRTRIAATNIRFVGHEFVQIVDTAALDGVIHLNSCIFRAGGNFNVSVATSRGCVLEGATLNLQGRGTTFADDFLISRITAGTGLSPGGATIWAVGTTRIWSPPVGARNNATIPLVLVSGSTVLVNVFSQLAFLSGTFASIAENGKIISQFTNDDSTAAKLLCTDSTMGALKYLDDIPADPLVFPVGGVYLYSVGGQLRAMNPAGVVTPLN